MNQAALSEQGIAEGNRRILEPGRDFPNPLMPSPPPCGTIPASRRCRRSAPRHTIRGKKRRISHRIAVPISSRARILNLYRHLRSCQLCDQFPFAPLSSQRSRGCQRRRDCRQAARYRHSPSTVQRASTREWPLVRLGWILSGSLILMVQLSTSTYPCRSPTAPESLLKASTDSAAGCARAALEAI